MASVNSVRIPGLATGMDTDKIIKDMLTGEQNKIDKVKQKEQTIKWQQEIYRNIIKDVKGFQDDYFSITSPNSIISSKSWNTLSVSSSDSNVITASGSAGASKVDYDFDVQELAQPAKMSASFASKNQNLGLTGDISFKIDLGDGKTYDPINLSSGDTVETMVKTINEKMKGEVKASYSEMTGKLTIETQKTGANSKLTIVNEKGDAASQLKTIGFDITDTKGSDSKIVVTSQGKPIDTLTKETNSFTIDNITYNASAIGTAHITSKTDAQPVVDNMKKFVEDYNKIMDKVYDLVTEKGNRDYKPLTEEQKKDMDEDEIKIWEEKAKKGVLRNDSEMRRFMDHMQNAIFGEHSKTLNEFGLTTHPDYNKKGQLSLDTAKFTKAIQDNGEKVYDIFTSGDNSVMAKMKDGMYKYVGTSSSLFAKKAGIEKTASVANNFYSDQIKQQQENIKNIQRKMQDKEQQLYQKFAALEASMNKFNSQMNHLMGQ